MISTRIHARSVILGIAGALLGGLALGCGPAGPDRAVVSGRVSYQGQPVAFGQIVFRPNATTQAASSGAEIIDGRYVADAKGGVPTGTFSVRIYAHRLPSGQPASAEEMAGDINAPALQQYIPAKYNDQSELTLTVEPGQTRVNKDFELP